MTKQKKSDEDRISYFDGYLYDKLIVPRMAEWNQVIVDRIEYNTTVVDIGCGVGALSFMLANKCKKVVGIDISSKMISFAKKKLAQTNFQNLTFLHWSGAQSSEIITDHFDIGILMMVLHETDEEKREKIVEEAFKMTNRIIISDYLNPFPLNSAGRNLKVVEFLAGLRHYKGFRSWMHNGGIDGFVTNLGLKIENEKQWVEPYAGCGKFMTVSR